MEELEKISDKGIYWGIFFSILIVVGVLGHNFVFNFVNEKKTDKNVIVEEEQFDLDSYLGVWQLYGNDEDNPEQELCINIVDGNVITFDYFVKDVAYFDSQTAEFDYNMANFEMEDREGKVFVSGKIIFKNNKVFLGISSSSLEDITTGTVEFREKGKDSILK